MATSPKTSFINLDNTSPKIISVKDASFGNGSNKNILGLFNTNVFSDTGEGSYPRFFLTDLYKLRFIDENTGIFNYKNFGKNVTSDIFNECLFASRSNTIENPSVIDWAGEGVIAGNGAYYMSYSALIQEINSHKNYFDESFSIYGDPILTSGSTDAYLGIRIFSRTINGNVEFDTITDNVGNNIEQPFFDGPYYIDVGRPVLETVTIDDDENGKIVITDDYSGLSEDSNILKKIKYKWVTDPNDVSQRTNLISINPADCEFSESNQFGYNKKVSIKINQPVSVGKYYLYAIIDGYEDIGGNPASGQDGVSNKFVGYVDDLQVTFKEQNTIGFPTSYQIDISSLSNGKFRVKNVSVFRTWYDDDAGTYKDEEQVLAKDETLVDGTISSSSNTLPIVSKGDSLTILASSTVNGPIKIVVTSYFGKVYTINAEIKNVQETKLKLSVEAGKKYKIPECARYSGKGLDYIKFGNQSMYVDSIKKKTIISTETNDNLEFCISGGYNWHFERNLFG